MPHPVVPLEDKFDEAQRGVITLSQKNDFPLYIHPSNFDCSDVDAELGVGAFGNVFKCNLLVRDGHGEHKMKSECAIKKMLMFDANPFPESLKPAQVIEGELTHDVPNLIRSTRYPFNGEPLREASFGSSLKDPIVSVYHVSLSSDGMLYLAMDAGESNMMSLHKLTSYEQIIHYSREMINCLAYLHSMGIGHGDVKLANYLLFPGERVKLADLGMSSSLTLRPTRTRNLMYTKEFRPPEYCLPYRYSVEDLMRGDLFACGASIYSLITGATPCEVLKIEQKNKILVKLCLSLGIPEEIDWPEDKIPPRARKMRVKCIELAKKYYFDKHTAVRRPNDAGAPAWSFLKISAGQILPMEFVDLLHNLLEFDPRKRWSARHCLFSSPLVPHTQHRIGTQIEAVGCVTYSPERSMIESENTWIQMLFKTTKKFCENNEPIIKVHADKIMSVVEESDYKTFMTSVLQYLRIIRKQLDDATWQLREYRKTHGVRKTENDEFSSKLKIEIIDNSPYPRSGFAEYAEGLMICMEIVIQTINKRLQKNPQLPSKDDALYYALGAFVVYDALRRFRQYGVSKYMNSPFFQELMKKMMYDPSNRRKAQKYLGELAAIIITTLDFHFSGYYVWDVATIFMRYICEGIGTEGNTYLCQYYAALLPKMEEAFVDLQIMQTTNTLKLGTELALQSLNEYKNQIPSRGAKVLQSVIARIQKEAGENIV